MAGYRPLYIKGNQTGLVQNRQEFILPEDAYPTLLNAYIFREQVRRKQGCEFLGRLQRNLFTNGSTNTGMLLTGLEASATIAPGSLMIIGSDTLIYTDPGGTGIIYQGFIPAGTINYQTGAVTGIPTPYSNSSVYGYYPNLPVMGIRSREVNTGYVNNIDQTIFFDTKYAYVYNALTNTITEYLPGTTWTGTNFNFFWTTNYWTSPSTGQKLMWASNFSGTGGDPFRYTDGLTWTNFVAPLGQIDATGTNFFCNALCLIPFRGRLVAFNTLEGATLGTSTQFSNRIRWAAIGNPLTTNAWRDDIQGQGGFLNIPTNQDITSVGFVRDNLIIYCENSTWQLRYTGRSIAPFQIEKVNSEFGAYSTFSAVQFDTSLVGIGDKGIIQCDSFKSERIDIKIPDLVFDFSQGNQGTQRIQGIRNFETRTAYWTYVDSDASNSPIFPTNRLIYNYENESWAIYQDSITALGNFQPPTGGRWMDYTTTSWQAANFAWQGVPAERIVPTAGNQQGFVYLLDQQVTNDPTLYISNITGNTPNTTTITSPNHNLQNTLISGQTVTISMPNATDPFYALNGQVFGVVIIDANSFSIFSYDAVTQLFDIPVPLASGVYLGGALIQVMDNFIVQSKKFNYLDQGQKYQIGYLDILMDNTDEGEITLNVYTDYNEEPTSQNQPNPQDTFFNVTIPTSAAGIGIKGGTKNWQRVFCPTQANFITLTYTLSNLQMTTAAQASDVQIDAQIIWSRPAGRMNITM
jgi:hypothetical protein